MFLLQDEITIDINQTSIPVHANQYYQYYMYYGDQDGQTELEMEKNGEVGVVGEEEGGAEIQVVSSGGGKSSKAFGETGAYDGKAKESDKQYSAGESSGSVDTNVVNSYLGQNNQIGEVAMPMFAGKGNKPLPKPAPLGLPVPSMTPMAPVAPGPLAKYESKVPEILIQDDNNIEEHRQVKKEKFSSSYAGDVVQGPPLKVEVQLAQVSERPPIPMPKASAKQDELQDDEEEYYYYYYDDQTQVVTGLSSDTITTTQPKLIIAKQVKPKREKRRRRHKKKFRRHGTITLPKILGQEQVSKAKHAKSKMAKQIHVAKSKRKIEISKDVQAQVYGKDQVQVKVQVHDQDQGESYQNQEEQKYGKFQSSQRHYDNDQNSLLDLSQNQADGQDQLHSQYQSSGYDQEQNQALGQNLDQVGSDTNSQVQEHYKNQGNYQDQSQTFDQQRKGLVQAGLQSQAQAHNQQHQLVQKSQIQVQMKRSRDQAGPQLPVARPKLKQQNQANYGQLVQPKLYQKQAPMPLYENDVQAHYQGKGKAPVNHKASDQKQFQIEDQDQNANLVEIHDQGEDQSSHGQFNVQEISKAISIEKRNSSKHGGRHTRIRIRLPHIVQAKRPRRRWPAKWAKNKGNFGKMAKNKQVHKRRKLNKQEQKPKELPEYKAILEILSDEQKRQNLRKPASSMNGFHGGGKRRRKQKYEKKRAFDAIRKGTKVAGGKKGASQYGLMGKDTETAVTPLWVELDFRAKVKQDVVETIFNK